MGCSSSAYVEPTTTSPYSSTNSNEDSVSEWKPKISEADALKLFESDGTLSSNSSRGQLELRALLSEPVSQPILGEFAKKHSGLQFFLCWIDIQEYKSIETANFRLAKALLICNKYVEVDSILDVGIWSDERENLLQSIQLAKSDNLPMPTKFFNELQRHCFDMIYQHLFIIFKKSDEYVAMNKLLKESYNYVRTDDFEYIKKLGEGGFGLVMHVIKKSTRQHYAMKIQKKRGLVECFPDDPWRVDSERKALVTSQHPFIINLEYAFQTDSLAIMVLGLGTAGDLRYALKIAPFKCLTVDRVQFYAAEMISALVHLHDMGLIYRDLKPNNVLLNADGHIQLVDMGAVTDTEGYVLDTIHVESENTPMFSVDPIEQREIPNLSNLNSDNMEHNLADAGMDELGGDTAKVHIKSDVKDVSPVVEDANNANTSGARREPNRKRAFTIIGTYGYMV